MKVRVLMPGRSCNKGTTSSPNAAFVLASPLVMPATEAPQALFASVIAPGVSVMASDWYWAPIAALSVPAGSCHRVPVA